MAVEASPRGNLLSSFRRRRNATVAYTRISQWQVLRDLRIAALRDAPQSFLGDASWEGRRTPADWSALLGEFQWFTATVDGKSVALTMVRQYPERPHELYLESVWVAKAHRNSGVVRGMMLHLRRHAAQSEINALRLAVLNGNDHALHAFEQLGFTCDGAPDHVEQVMVLRF